MFDDMKQMRIFHRIFGRKRSEKTVSSLAVPQPVQFGTEDHA